MNEIRAIELDLTSINPRYEITIFVTPANTKNCRYTDGSTLRVIILESSVSIQDMETGKQINQATFEGEHPGDCPQAKSGDFNIIGGISPELYPWIANTLLDLPGTTLPGFTRINIPELQTTEEEIEPKDTSLALSTNEQYLFVRSNHKAWIWDIVNHKFIRQVKFGSVFEPSPDGLSYVFQYDDEYNILLIDTLTGNEMMHFFGDFGPTVFSAAFSPDGKLLVTTSWNYHGAIVWNVATGKELRRLPEDGLADRAAFSGDGKWLVVGQYMEFTVWELANNQ